MGVQWALSTWTTLWRRSFLLLVWLVCSSALFALAHWEGARQEQRRLETFGADLEGLAQVSATILSNRLQQLDDVLLTLRAGYLAAPGDFPATVRLLRNGPLADSSLQVVRVDRDGLLAFTDAPNASAGLYLGDREYFKLFSEGAADRFHIDQPVFGRVTKRLSVPLVRPVLEPGGAFSGVVALSVTQASLTEFGARLHFSGDTVVTLVNLEGALVSRSHGLETMQGQRLSPEMLAPLLVSPSGVLTRQSPFDGVERTLAFRRLDNLPLIVIFAASPSGVLAETTAQSRVLLFSAALTSLALLALLWLLASSIQRRNEAARVIATQRTHLAEAQRVSGMGSWEVNLTTGAMLCSDEAQNLLDVAPEVFPRDIEGFLEYVPADERDLIRRMIAQAASDGRLLFEHHARRGDGVERLFLQCGELIQREGAGPTLIGTVRDVTEQRAAERALADSEARLRSVIAVMAEGVIVLAVDGSVQSCNSAAERILGAELCRGFPLLGGATDSYWLREDGSPLLPADLPPLLTLATGRAVDRMILGLRQAAAGELWLSMSSRPLPHDNSESYAAVVSFVDVTVLRQAGLDGRMAQAIFENVGQPVVVTDADARILMINPAAAAVTGFSAEEALGQRPSLWRSDRHDKAFYERMWQAVIENGQWIGEIWNRNKAGEAFPVLLSVTAIRDPSSHATRYVGIYTDITERKRSEAEMWRRANFDPLTGLPNRMLLYERLDRSLARAVRESTRLAVLFIDLDGFKPVNDQYGHQAGDVVLGALAARMQLKLRDSDTVSRLGGDEFVVLLQSVGSNEEVLHVAEGLLTAVEAPVEYEERLIYLSCSIGIAFFPENALSREALMVCADAAMYRAKAAGKGRLCIGDPRLL